MPILPLHRCTDVRAWLLQAYADPGTAFPPMISTPGYTLPRLGSLAWYAATTGVSVSGINVHQWSASTTNNWVVSPADGSARGSLTAVFVGDASNNVLVLGPNTDMHGQVFFHGHGGLIMIGSDMGQRSELTARLWSRDNLLVWGHKCTSNSVDITIEGDDTSVVLGDDCMLARDVNIRTSDEHAILELDGGRFLNPAASVHVEPRVWLGDKCTLLKGVHVGYGSIVGNSSVVTRSVGRFSIATGIPARTVRTGVSWSRFHEPEPGLIGTLRELEAQLVGPAPLAGSRIVDSGKILAELESLDGVAIEESVLAEVLLNS